MRLLILLFMVIFLATAVYGAQCVVNFDLVCPDVIPLCGATFGGGLSCVVEAGACSDTGARAYKLNENNSVQINFTNGIHAIEVFFAGSNGANGTMNFHAENGSIVNTITTNGDCSTSSPAAQSLRFNDLVHQINVVGDGDVFIDSMIINPSTICGTTDALCDGIDDDCDGRIDEDANVTCDDGQYCNGLELCLNGACQAGTNIDCSGNNIAGIDSCSNTPDGNSLTRDLRSAFVSSCDENTDSCTTGDATITHTCALVCGASCTADSDCTAGFMCATDSCSCVQDPNQTPTVTISDPVNNSLVTTRNFTLSFSTINWTIGGKNTTHLFFNIDNIPGLSFLDNLIFYNGADQTVELNDAETQYASYIDSDTIQFNEVPDGLHLIRAQLVDETNTPAVNPESETFIQVLVNDTKCVVSSECEDYNLCTADSCDTTTNECINRNIQNGVLGCGTGACFRQIDRCVNGAEQVCTPGLPGIEICDGIDNDCNGVIDDDPVCDVSMTIHMPTGGIYDNRRVQFDIEVSQDVDYISMIDHAETRPREKKLCRNCDEYGHDRDRFVSFRDGFHNVTISAVKDSYLDFEEVQFFVDSTKPRVSKTEPRRGFANGNFHIQFREDNPSTLTLYYGNDSDKRASSVDLNNCYEVRRGTTGCDVFADISDFDGHEIEYYFNLTDIAGSHGESRTTSLDVDQTAPVLMQVIAIPNGRRVLLNITSSEEGSIGMIDHADRRPRWKTLCRNCDSYERTRTFITGEHNLTIRAVDPAGNEDVKNVSFVI